MTAPYGMSKAHVEDTGRKMRDGLVLWSVCPREEFTPGLSAWGGSADGGCGGDGRAGAHRACQPTQRPVQRNEQFASAGSSQGPRGPSQNLMATPYPRPHSYRL